jgi:hypothetical protein
MTRTNDTPRRQKIVSLLSLAVGLEATIVRTFDGTNGAEKLRFGIRRVNADFVSPEGHFSITLCGYTPRVVTNWDDATEDWLIRRDG